MLNVYMKKNAVTEILIIANYYNRLIILKETF